MIRRFLSDCSGIVFAEFAAALPMLVLILLGGFEAGRYVMIGLKLDRAATSLADVVGQYEGLTQTQIMDLLRSGRDMLAPYELCTGNAIISGVQLDTATNKAVIRWQSWIPSGAKAVNSGSGGTGITSSVGQATKTAKLPAGLTLTTSQPDLIAAEVFYEYKPFFGGDLFKPNMLTSRAFTRPRGDAIGGITPVTPAPKSAC
jgi:Flp pilus assembly protein TadG